ncbi:MAG: ATP-binding cassette domain-containing protein [Lachnospiraceae bacterium]|nr:ATP-binding cassette domain-containing protein [Lachnospiraceae bacterium]
MKKELLRITNLNCQYKTVKYMVGINICLLEDECVGFLGLSDSGKDFLIDFICGDVEEDIRSAHFYLEGRRITGNEEIKRTVYHMKESNFVLDQWTVAEYIGLVGEGWLWMDRQQKAQMNKTEAYFRDLGLDMDSTRKLGNLSEMEKRIVDLVKMISRGSKIIIIDDDFEGMPPQDIEEFNRVLRLVMKKYRMAAVLNLRSSRLMMKYLDRYIFFRDGRITKKCRRGLIHSDEQIDIFLLGKTRTTRKKELDAFTYRENEEHIIGQECVYRVCNLELENGEQVSLSFEKGKVTTFLSLNDTEREHLFDVLSGRTRDHGTYWIIGKKRIDADNVSRFVKCGVVSIKQLGSREEAFSNMSVGENLLLPSLCKITSADYIMFARQIQKTINSNKENLTADMSALMKDMELNDYVALSMERWYLYNPRVLILLDPFDQCDFYGISIVKSYIIKLSKRGTAVIIIKSREEFVADISDEIINLN